MDSMTIVSSNMYVHKLKWTLQTIILATVLLTQFYRCKMHGTGMYVQVQVDCFVPFSQS